MIGRGMARAGFGNGRYWGWSRASKNPWSCSITLSSSSPPMQATMRETHFSTSGSPLAMAWQFWTNALSAVNRRPLAGVGFG